MWHANMWDWLSTSFMMVGFTILLALSAYLVACLMAGASGDAPDEEFDSRPIYEDQRELTWLAS